MNRTLRVGGTIATISFLAWFGLGFLLRALDVISSDAFVSTWAIIWIILLLPLGFAFPLVLTVWRSKNTDKDR